MRTFLQIWSQKNPVQELRIVPTNLEESLYPREQCAIVLMWLLWYFVFQQKPTAYQLTAMCRLENYK